MDADRRKYSSATRSISGTTNYHWASWRTRAAKQQRMWHNSTLFASLSDKHNCDIPREIHCIFDKHKHGVESAVRCWSRWYWPTARLQERVPESGRKKKMGGKVEHLEGDVQRGHGQELGEPEGGRKFWGEDGESYRYETVGDGEMEITPVRRWGERHSRMKAVCPLICLCSGAVMTLI